MSSNPTLSLLLGWGEMHGGFMELISARKQANAGKLIAAHAFCLWLEYERVKKKEVTWLL